MTIRFVPETFEAARQRSTPWPVVRRAWGRWRPGLIVALPIVLGAVCIAVAVQALRLEQANAAIRALKGGHDVAVPTDARPEVMLARIEYLLAHDKVDAIQPYVEALDKTGSDDLRAIAHYNFANGRLRRAFDQIVADKLESAGPYVVLSRQEYRRALTLNPNDWDAKFNLDVASRLVRDFPAFERTMGDEVKVDRKKIWTDIPGKPEGLP